MVISGLLKSEATVEVEGIKMVVKRYPLGFYEYLQLKSIEGKSLTYEKGQLKKVESFGNYDIELYVDQLINGLQSWQLLDTNGYAIPLNRENCMSLLQDYPDFAKQVLELISKHNNPIVDNGTKKN